MRIPRGTRSRWWRERESGSRNARRTFGTENIAAERSGRIVRAKVKRRSGRDVGAERNCETRKRGERRSRCGRKGEIDQRNRRWCIVDTRGCENRRPRSEWWRDARIEGDARTGAGRGRRQRDGPAILSIAAALTSAEATVGPKRGMRASAVRRGRIRMQAKAIGRILFGKRVSRCPDSCGRRRV